MTEKKDKQNVEVPINEESKIASRSLLCNMGIHQWVKGKCGRCGKKK